MKKAKKTTRKPAPKKAAKKKAKNPCKKNARRNAADSRESKIQQGLELYQRFKWGRTAKKSKQINFDFSDVVVSLGKLAAVEYVTAKGEEKAAAWRHEFSAPLPTLASNPEGTQLYILGGGYKIKREGIVK
jgi:hypothetical protein